MMKAKDYLDPDKGHERRFIYSPVGINKRDDSDPENGMHTIEGIAAKVGVRTNIGWFDEIIEPGAFDNCLKGDTRCLFNHNPDLILARSQEGKGTLELYLTNEGHLGYRYTTPDRTYAMDLQDAIDKGDVSQSSFAFKVKEQSWVEPEKGSNDNELRKILEVELLMDVSPVTYPAYHDTSVAKRSWDGVQQERHSDKESESNPFDEFDAQYMFNQNVSKNG